MRRKLLLWSVSLCGLASCQAGTTADGLPEPVQVDLCDDLIVFDGQLISVEGYIWTGIPAIWSPACPDAPLPTGTSTNREVDREIRTAMAAATDIRETEMVVEADYIGYMSKNEHGAQVIKISKMEHVRLIPHPASEGTLANVLNSLQNSP